MRKATARLLLWKKACWQLNENKLLEQCEVRCFGIPDEFVMHGDKKLLFRDLGLDTPTIAAKAAAFVKGEEE